MNNKYPDDYQERIVAFWELAKEKYWIPRNSNFKLPDRTWPDKDITEAPIWCSSCLRDWNQSIFDPMNIDEKIEFFNYLVWIWFKEIEVWFPSSWPTEFNFIRKLIEEDLIPDDVKIQVLVPAKQDLIKKTFESLKWAKNVIVHLYNSTSTNQRENVFKKTKPETIDLALDWVKWIKEEVWDFEWNLTFQYSPESFTWTEMDFAEEISRKVIDQWWNLWWNPMILNLPATVENTTPDRYADKIEYFSRIVKEYSDKILVILSVHAHNDRGTWVAATELAIKAWADRVEWTLLWNWERTWNADIITLWLNLFTQWIDPKLDLSYISIVADRVAEIINIPINQRQAYVWELVHSAFSWTHQDAIAKWFDAQKSREKDWDLHWEVPYLPIDPGDIWFKFKPIKINGQSWKWWICYILKNFWYDIPKEIQPAVLAKFKEFNEANICFDDEYVKVAFEYHFVNVEWRCPSNIDIWSLLTAAESNWIWIINQLVNEISEVNKIEFEVMDYQEKAITSWRSSDAISWFKIKYKWNIYYWAWVDKDINTSAVKWLISTLNIALSSK